jgi:hypothetical protein
MFKNYSVKSWVAAVVSGTTPSLTTNATSLYNGTSATSLPQGCILCTGTNYYYVPVVRATSTYLREYNYVGM